MPCVEHAEIAGQGIVDDQAFLFHGCMLMTLIPPHIYKSIHY